MPGLLWAANFFPKELVRHWHSLSGAMLEPPSLEVQKHVNLGMGVSGERGVDDLRGLFQPC